MKKKEIILVSVMSIFGVVFSDQAFKFAIGFDDFLKIEDSEWLRWGLSGAEPMGVASVITGMIIFVLAALSIYKIVDLIKKENFVLVLALNFIAGGLISMFIDVLLFGGIRHWVFFFDSLGFAIADLFVITGLILYLLLRRMLDDGAKDQADSGSHFAEVSRDT
jgi:hypothetical protein